AQVLRRPADGDEVGPAVAVEVGDGQVFHRYPARIDVVALPLGPPFVQRLVDADAAALADFLAQVVAHADDQLVVAVAVEVGAPAGVAPFQLIVDDVPLPLLARRRRLGVDDDLVAVPRLDGGDELVAALESALLDLAGAAVAGGVLLVAVAELLTAPLARPRRR